MTADAAGLLQRTVGCGELGEQGRQQQHVKWSSPAGCIGDAISAG